MSLIQIESSPFDNWKALINSKFLDNGRFKKILICLKKQKEVEVFGLKEGESKYPTTIEVGYIGDKLLYIHIHNPRIPGYVRFQEGEYFHRHDFTDGKSHGEPGLEFNELNIESILSEFSKGLQGKEIHCLRKGNIVKARLYPFPEMPDKCYTYDFEKAGLLERFKNIFKKSDNTLEIREIMLNEIFSGI